jgi:hypothetical protein
VPAARSSLTSAAAVAAAGVLGAAAGALGSVAHQAVVGAPRWPVGLALAIALTASVADVLRACRVGLGASAVAVLAWLLVVLQAAGRRPEGDVLVPPNVRGYGWLVAGFAVLLGVLLAPGRRRPKAPR